jgi:hypothetical protein
MPEWPILELLQKIIEAEGVIHMEQHLPVHDAVKE